MTAAENAAPAHWVIGLELTGRGECSGNLLFDRAHSSAARLCVSLAPSINSSGVTLSLADEPEARLFPERPQ